MFCLYITIHFPTSKYYVGKSASHKVTSGKYKGSGVVLAKAFKKYPKNEWNTYILAEFIDESAAYDMEERIVDDEMIDDPKCMNVRGGGVGQKRISEETREKLRAASTGRKHTDETKAKVAAAGVRPCNNDTRKKIADAQKGKPRPAEGIEKMTATRRSSNHKHSEETKQQMSKIHTERQASEEYRQQQSMRITKWWEDRRRGLLSQ